MTNNATMELKQRKWKARPDALFILRGLTGLSDKDIQRAKASGIGLSNWVEMTPEEIQALERTKAE